jgi:hypothetical protein
MAAATNNEMTPRAIAVLVLLCAFVTGSFLYALFTISPPSGRKTADELCAQVGGKYWYRGMCVRPDGSLWQMPERN